MQYEVKAKSKLPLTPIPHASKLNTYPKVTDWGCAPQRPGGFWEAGCDDVEGTAGLGRALALID